MPEQATKTIDFTRRRKNVKLVLLWVFRLPSQPGLFMKVFWDSAMPIRAATVRERAAAGKRNTTMNR